MEVLSPVVVAINPLLRITSFFDPIMIELADKVPGWGFTPLFLLYSITSLRLRILMSACPAVASSLSWYFRSPVISMVPPKFFRDPWALILRRGESTGIGRRPFSSRTSNKRFIPLLTVSESIWTSPALVRLVTDKAPFSVMPPFPTINRFAKFCSITPDVDVSLPILKRPRTNVGDWGPIASALSVWIWPPFITTVAPV